jgi:hypothetical protein
MKLLIKLLFSLMLFATIVTGCMRDDLDMDKFSERFKIEREIALPLAYGSIYLKDFMEDTDSILVIEADSSFSDTIEFSAGDETDNFELEYFYLYHKTANYLPVAADLTLVTYDSITQRNLDTIKFIENNVFLQAAPIDKNGNAIISEVDTIKDKLVIDKQEAENILNVATHIIFEARLISDTTVIIPINENKRIWLKYGFEAKGSYSSEFGSDEEE